MAAPGEPAPKPRVGYVISKELLYQADRIQNIRQRASMVHQLLCAYRLTDGMAVIEPELADEDDIRNFHSGDYVDYLASVNGSGDLEKHDDDLDEYGLGFDCPLVSGILDLARTVAGASLSAARALCQRRVDVAINWCGGWHHAQRDGASGFCYVNDAVLAIGELRSTFDRVLYVDLDIHHGDGVENAFLYSSKVFTYSIHHYEDGYFPGTGSIDDVGCGRGRYFCCNVPLKEGATDDTFFTAFDSSIAPVLSAFRPDALVIQCGADGLAGDPLGTFGLTPAGLARCVHRLLGAGLPTLLLGGGGYNAPNVARCWAQLTALVLGRRLASDIPDHQFFMRYGPSFDLDISAGLRKDHNTPEYIQAIVKRVKENMECVEDSLHQ